MAISKCPNCDNLFFELKEASPTNAAYKYSYVQCAMCGTVVGVTEYLNIGALILKQNEAIKKIARALNVHVDL